MADELALLREASARLAGAARAKTASGGVPTVQRGLDVLLEAATTMAYGAPPDVSVGAQRLLLPSSIDVESHAREVQQLQLQSTPDDGGSSGVTGGSSSGGAGAVGATDVGAFVASMHRAITSTVISEAAATTAAYLSAGAAACMDAEWEAAKAELLGVLGLGVDLGAAADASAEMAATGPGPASLAALAAVANFDAGVATIPVFVPANAGTAAAPGAAAVAPLGKRWGYGPGDDAQLIAAAAAARGATPLAVDAIAQRFGLCMRDVSAHASACLHSLASPLPGAVGATPVQAFSAVATDVELGRAGDAAATLEAGEIPPLTRMWTLLLEVTRESLADGVGFGTYTAHYGGDVAALAAAASGGGGSVGRAGDAADGGAPSDGALRAAIAAASAGAPRQPLIGADHAKVPVSLGMTPGMQRHWCMAALQYLQELFDHTVRDNLAVVRRRRQEAAARNARDAFAGSTDLYLPGDAVLPPIVADVRAHLQLILSHHPNDATGATAGGAAPANPAWFEWAVATGTVFRDLPLFPQVYLLLRCGAVEEARSLVAACKPTDAAAAGIVAHVLRALDCYDGYLRAVAADTGRAADATGGRIASVVAASEYVAGWRRDVTGAAMTPAKAQFASMEELGREFGACVAAEAVLGAGGAGAGAAAHRGGGRIASLPYGDDPWYAQVCCLLCGGVDGTSDRVDAAMMSTMQDYLWHRMWCAVTSPLATAAAAARAGGSGGDRPYYELATLAAEYMTAGSEAYDPTGANAHFYTELMLMLGQPEAAIAHLATRGAACTGGRHLHEAVHLAVTMDYYGLLRVTPSAVTLAQRGVHDRVTMVDIEHTGRLLQSVTVGRGASAQRLVSIDLARLYALYSLYVLAASPELPCRYYATLRDAADRVERLACHLAESRAFATLAGPLPYAGGTLRPAAGTSFLACHGSDLMVVTYAEVCRIIITAGAVAQAANAHFDALQLYLRVGAPGPGVLPALRLLNEKLRGCAAQSWLPDETTEAAASRELLREIGECAAAAAVDVATEIQRAQSAGRSSPEAALFRDVPLEGVVACGSSLNKLLRACDFFDLLAAGAWADALQVLDEAALVPAPAVGGGAAEVHAEWIRLYDHAQDEVRAIIPVVMRGAAEAAMRAATGLRTAGGGAGAAMATSRGDVAGAVTSLKQRVRALRTGHTDLMRSRIPGAVLEELRAMDDAIQMGAGARFA